MINVMQIVHDLNFGGMQRVVVDLCLNVEPARFSMSVCCLEELGPNAKELEQRGIPVFLVKKKPGLDWLLPLRLRKLFLKQKVQVVHTHGINPFFYGTIGAILAKVPVKIQTDHARGVFPVARKEMISEMVLSWFVDRIGAVSEGVKSDLVKYEHISPKKIKVIYNGIDESKFRVKIDQKKKREELGIDRDDKVIGIGVRLSEQKGIRYLIEAVSLVVKSFSNIKLLIIGDGEYRSNLENLALDYGIADKVIFTGFRNDIPELLQVIDIYVLPSFREGHPLVLLEAMAAGKPVVATDIPGNRETVEYGKTGMLVPTRNSEELAIALLKLLEDDEMRHKMGIMGHKRFGKLFIIDKMVKKYQDLYENETIQ
jgi:glycosyltransferase involved in cell wall biosynthesis